MNQTTPLSIGILGTGHIGKTLARKLSAAGHSVKVANSRGPETIEADTLETGALPVKAENAVSDVDVVILSMPLASIPAISQLIQKLPPNVIVADTSNYYPFRDRAIDEIETGQVESEWVETQLHHPVIKVWNAIGSDSFARKGKPAGDPHRIAIPVAGDNEAHKKIVMMLVNDTGFDAFDAGQISDSWRQQPGAPAYCTDLPYDEMAAALCSAEFSRLPARRNLAVAAVQERMGDSKTNPDADFLVRLNRALYM
ncbi:NADP oxidoreductase [Buttiauxella warmboldiae]|uniref:NADP oxidoreductase n=1 Tax=Buttiauxella warmboldiae TaxID=82993 RepID=A0A3N5DQC0_9ENTR|nr:NAD(P)-binding domain-containing protein [Buttiauxella warmboldiae]RPH27810.1 NADP oxidoreductase [Buttiauxella warmboldiae]